MQVPSYLLKDSTDEVLDIYTGNDAYDVAFSHARRLSQEGQTVKVFKVVEIAHMNGRSQTLQEPFYGRKIRRR
jgi:hypothetical protein